MQKYVNYKEVEMILNIDGSELTRNRYEDINCQRNHIFQFSGYRIILCKLRNQSNVYL